MREYLIGTYQMFPLTSTTRQMFILQYLRPIGEYQECLAHIYEHKTMQLIFGFLDMRNACNPRLCFEAIRLLGSLLFHKKFCLEFVNQGGIERLLQIPTFSLQANAVSLCLWYLAYCEEAQEIICQLRNDTVDQVVKYAIKLLTSSHRSSKTHAVMFFGTAFKFPAILARFNARDGLRELVNVISTMQSTQDDVTVFCNISTDNWQLVKQVFLSLKQYYEASLVLFVQKMALEHNVFSNYVISTPPYKPVNVSAEAVFSNIENLLENTQQISNYAWDAVLEFFALDGLTLLLRGIAMVFDGFQQTPVEASLYALECLTIISVTTDVKSALCNKVSIAVNHLGIYRPQEMTGYALLVGCLQTTNRSNIPSIQKAALRVLINCLGVTKPLPFSIVDRDGRSISRAWDCVRMANGIMPLLNILQTKTPISDADCLRTLACRALIGLSKSDAAKQIMSKLPIFVSGQLQMLMKEPVMLDKRAEHAKFQKYARDLCANVCGHYQPKPELMYDVSIMQSIHRADVVARTVIKYNKEQLLQLIQAHLMQEGYKEVAAGLQRAAKLPPLPPNLTPHPTTPRKQQNNSNRNSNSEEEMTNRVNLDYIIKEYLTKQHSLCKYPVRTCPAFDLFRPHQCPEPKKKRSPDNNVTAYHLRRPYHTQPLTLPPIARKFIYSRYKLTETIKPYTAESIFTCCALSLDDQRTVIGMRGGGLQVFNKRGYENTYNGHSLCVSGLVAGHNQLLLSSSERAKETILWSMNDVFLPKAEFPSCHQAFFSNSQDKLIGTEYSNAKLYDINTKQVISEFQPADSNQYYRNQARLNQTDEIVLTDGVLFDVKSGKQIHKFDKMNPMVNGIFHRNDLEVISSSEVWDLRTFQLLHTVPFLQHSEISFNNAGDIIFGMTVADPQFYSTARLQLEPSFTVVDATDYSSIATVEMRGKVMCVSVNSCDTEVAILESDRLNTCVRLYQIGMSREVDEAADDSEEESDDADSNSSPDWRGGMDTGSDNDDNDEDNEDNDDDNEDNDEDNEDNDVEVELDIGQQVMDQYITLMESIRNSSAVRALREDNMFGSDWDSE